MPQTILLAFVSVATSCVFSMTGGEKTNELAILVLLPITGDKPRIGEGCRIGAEIIFNEVNKRNDILPDYNVSAVYKDEGGHSALSAASVAQFRREFLQQPTHHLAPIVVGGYYSGGCSKLANHIQFYNMVHIAVSCSELTEDPKRTSKMAGNRRLYPNLYRTRTSGGLAAYPQLHFMRKVGGWNRFGIITNAADLFDYSVAGFLLKVALEEGFNISFFDVVIDIDVNVMLPLKESDTRIIVVDTSLPLFALQFLCQAYAFGITGSSFVFIIHVAASFEPFDDGCGKKILQEQMKYVFWIGWSLAPPQSSLFDHNSTERLLSVSNFEAEFNRLTHGTKPADYNKRFNCADAALQAVLALDNSERILNSRNNLSLRDYDELPFEVMTVVNDTVAKTDFLSYRIGRFRYSSRLEVDSDIQSVTQWSPAKGEVDLFDVIVTNPNDLYNYSSYSINSSYSGNLQWMTKDGNPPKDRASVLNKIQAIGIQVFFPLLILSILVLGFEIVVFVAVEFDKRRARYISFRWFSTRCFAIGCFFLSIAGVLFLTSATFPTSFPQPLCVAERSVLIISFTLIDGYLICKMESFFSSRLYSANIKKKPRRNAPKAPPLHHRFIAHDVVRREKKTLLGMILWIFLGINYVSLWLAIETPRVDVETSISGISALDTIVVTHTYQCGSGKDLIWLTSIVAFHAIMLSFAAFISFEVRRVPHFAKLFPDAKEVIFAIKNVATLFVGGVFIVVVTINYPVEQHVAISVITVLISGLTFSIIYIKLFVEWSKRNYFLRKVVAVLSLLVRPNISNIVHATT